MNLTEELYFKKDDATTVAEVKGLFEKLLAETWIINIYRNREAEMVNLKSLGWSIEFSNTKTSAGQCKWKNRRNIRGQNQPYAKRVSLSMHFMAQNLGEGKGREWEEVIRHELAHAVDVEIRGKSNHDRVWQAVAKAMLSTGERTFSKDHLKDEKLSKYTLKCVEDECEYTRPSHKKRKSNARSFPACTTCYDAGKGYKRLVQVQNY